MTNENEGNTLGKVAASLVLMFLSTWTGAQFKEISYLKEGHKKEIADVRLSEQSRLSLQNVVIGCEDVNYDGLADIELAYEGSQEFKTVFFQTKDGNYLTKDQMIQKHCAALEREKNDVDAIVNRYITR